MDDPFFSEVQDAWLLSEFNRQSSTESSHDTMYSSSYSSSISISKDDKPPFNDHTRCSPELVVELDLASYSVPVAQSLAAEGTPPLDMECVLHRSSIADEMGNSGITPFEEDVLMMDPVLDYINEMLMEEGMEDHMCMQEQCIAYQAIVNGFYQIIDGGPSPSPADSSIDSNEDPSQPSLISEDNKKLFLEGDDEYSAWIEQILKANPSTPSSSSQISSSFRQDKAEGDQHVKPWVNYPSALLAEIMQNDGDGDGVGATDFSHSDYFFDAQISECQVNALASSPSFQVNMSSGVAGTSSFSDTARTEGLLLQINGGLEDVRASNSVVQLDTTRYADTTAGGGRSGDAGNKGGQQQGNGLVQRIANGSPTDGDFSFVKNEDLKLEEGYENLYAGKWSTREKGSANRKSSATAVGGLKEKRKGNNSNEEAALGSVDLRELLVSCARAVAGGDMKKAKEGLQELRRHGASPNGSGLQRLAHYFSEALVARMCGTGGLLYRAALNYRPSTAKLLKTFKLGFEVCPYGKLQHYFANQNILKAAEGASQLHVIDYGILYGLQWPCLINALADRKGGPPMLVITGIEFSQPGVNPGQRVEDTGRRLAEYARTYHVPFEYHAIAASRWEDVDAASLQLQQGEVLVVNCIKRFRHFLDESLFVSCPRQTVLGRMRSFNPKLLVTGVISAGFNAPFFVSRFREAVYYYPSTFDMLETTWDESEERIMMERDWCGRWILNIVAREGVERVERAETYKQWQARIQRAGFQQLPIIPTILSRCKFYVNNYHHKDFNVHDDSNGWVLLGWKGSTQLAMSAWKPIPHM